MAALAEGPVIIMGAGAIGGFVGGRMALAGQQVILLDPWAEHVEAIRRDGLRLETPEGIAVARPRALHLHELHLLRRRGETPAAFGILSAKLYDTAWAAQLLASLLPAGVPVLTLQNALVEELVGAIAGPQRVLGGVAGQMDVQLLAPGQVKRSRRTGMAPEPVLKVGETTGRATPRAQAIAARLATAETCVVTTTLWEERWAKLCMNTMTSGVSGIGGLTLKRVLSDAALRPLLLRLAAEALAVGAAMGFEPAKLYGIPAARFPAGAAGDAAALAEIDDALRRQTDSMADDGISGTLQDLRKGRRTEVDFFNGFIAERGAALGVPAFTHAAIAARVRALEAGEGQPDPALLKPLLEG
jgi:2-dehydropantoate 2-reductase